MPSTCWYTNVRSQATEDEWDKIRIKSYRKANHKCEICGDVGTNQGVYHSVECHEIWEYNDEAKIQKLVGLISLCPFCHKVKRPGLAAIKGESHIVDAQLMKVNGMNELEALAYIDLAFDQWQERSKYEWELDITYLEEYMKEPPPSDNWWENL